MFNKQLPHRSTHRVARRIVDLDCDNVFGGPLKVNGAHASSSN
jgi:hypothetical protein